jgi:hypothetical protein
MPADMLRQVIASGMAPEEVASLAANAVHDGTFYVFTHPDMMAAVQTRADAIMHGRNPQLSMNL